MHMRHDDVGRSDQCQPPSPCMSASTSPPKPLRRCGHPLLTLSHEPLRSPNRPTDSLPFSSSWPLPKIRTLEQEIGQVLADGAWATTAAVLLATPGIGLVTTAWLLVGTLNFTVATSPEQLTAYVGLAPRPRESGMSVRGRARIGHRGNARLRTALYMATLSAARFNPTIKAFYQRLRAAGTPMKVARCAAARKLLHLAWALVRSQQPYRALAELVGG